MYGCACVFTYIKSLWNFLFSSTTCRILYVMFVFRHNRRFFKNNVFIIKGTPLRPGLNPIMDITYLSPFVRLYKLTILTS